MLDDIPTPAAIAGRPRDPRGYPIPAITPWQGGVPQFASTGVARTFLCAFERRCSVCGTVMADGPVWRVVGGDESLAIAAALAAGRPYHNAAPTAEAPGHRTCMLYAALACPYLSRPNARRGSDAVAAGLSAGRGSRRGLGGAVTGFARYDFEYSRDEGVLFRFDGLIEYLPHEVGSEHLPALAAAVVDETGPALPAPGYLLADEDAAQREFTAQVHRLLGD